MDRWTGHRAGQAHYNPLYYSGQLAIILLIILTVTGIYLTLLYRPGSDRAYQSVVVLGSNWFGSLMRTSHRYASDALIVVVLIHALKMFVSDRFWGSRWFAWVTGWALLALTWSLGVMGYWLVWDKPAQWLTEWAFTGWGGPLAYSFFTPSSATATFAIFVIILFLHIFIPPLVGVGVVIHVLRVARAKYWAPRWLWIMIIVALAIVSIALPVANSQPVNFAEVVSSAPIDWLYMGFVPFAEWSGSLLTWTLTGLLTIILFALPWLWSGHSDGPAAVIDENCTGCAACARECPYLAIEMRPRDDETPYNSLARVNPDLCTGCGICVGSCPDAAIELDRLPSPVVRQDLQRKLAEIGHQDEAIVTIYMCDRHMALGTVVGQQAPTQPPGQISLLQADLPPRVTLSHLADDAGNLRPVMLAAVPCSGMLHPNWASETLDAGGAGAIVVGCPAGDCGHREGPFWIQKRLVRRRTLRKGNTHFLDLAPGRSAELRQLWLEMIEPAGAPSAPSRIGKREVTETEPGLFARWRQLTPGFLLLIVTLLLSLLPTFTVNRPNVADSGVRILINHSGQLLAAADTLPADIAAQLPPNVDPATILGGERFPVHLRLRVNSEIMLEKQYDAGGLRREGAIFANELVGLPAGAYNVQIELMDDGTTWRTVFDAPVQLNNAVVRTLIWEASSEQFLAE